MPVVRPWRASTETVKAVPSGASFTATIGSRCRRRASSTESGAHTMPEVWRMMKALFSGVHSDAATNRSPSFSRSSSSATTSSSPREKAATVASTRSWDSRSIIANVPRRGETARLFGPALRPGRRRADLAPMAQIVIGEHASEHRLADRDRADADAGVMAAFGGDLGVAAVAVDRGARGENRGRRLDGEAGDDRLAGRDAAENPAGLIGQETRPAVVSHPHLVGVCLAGQGRSGKAGTDLDALDRVDTHQRRRDLAVEL